MFFLLIFLNLAQYCVSQYEGDSCTDRTVGAPGVCCALAACAPAMDDLRQRRQPTPCSFNQFTPVVCCRERCGGGATPATPSIQGDRGGTRASERACAEIDNILPETRSKREAYHYDYGQHEYYSPPEPPMYPDYPAPNEPGVMPQEESTALPTTAAATDTTTIKTPVYGVIGGVDASAFEFPHMAAVGWPLKTGGYAFYCGGTLISDRFVMTAGHCLVNARDTSLANVEPTIVRLGDLNILENITDGAIPIDIPILRTIRHPNYRPPVKYFDIALLELQSPITLTDHIYPACLWTNPEPERLSTAIVTGWGTTVSGGLNLSPALQKVEVNILDTEVCQPLLRSSWNRNWQGFNDHQICAGELAGGKDACQGDSGGPLQNTIQGYTKKYHVIGVTSFGRECGKTNLPGVYTRVSAFVDWIESVVWPTGE